ncbi:MAG: hypothetical protein AAGB31_07440, partial [Bdellovibrio sp.]
MAYQKTLTGFVLGTLMTALPAWAGGPLCQQLEQKDFEACLNDQVVSSQMTEAEDHFNRLSSRLIGAYGLKSEEKGTAFRATFAIQNGVPGIEVRGADMEGLGQNFHLPSLFREKRAAVIENNIRKVINFTAWYHARSFGRLSSPLFSFQRVEMRAHPSAQLSMELRDRTLQVLLPQQSSITEKDLIEYWNSGRVLVPAAYSRVPMPLIKLFSGMGDSGKIGKMVLEHWNLLNPVGDFRVRLQALYLGKAGKAIEMIRRRLDVSEADKERMISFLQDPEENAKSLESLFSLEKIQSSPQEAVIVNRRTFFCPIKVSNS